jgi:hypothetical protein
MMSVNTLELSSQDEKSGLYTGGGFREAWTAATSFADLQLFLFRTKRRPLTGIKEATEVAPDVFRIGLYSNLAPDQRDRVRVASSYGGHCSTILCSQSELFAKSITAAYSQAVRHDSLESCARDWIPDDWKAYVSFVAPLAQSWFCLSFGHDGDPALLTGPSGMPAGATG